MKGSSKLNYTRWAYLKFKLFKFSYRIIWFLFCVVFLGCQSAPPERKLYSPPPTPQTTQPAPPAVQPPPQPAPPAPPAVQPPPRPAPPAPKPKPQPKTKVPNVVGLPCEKAKNILKESNLECRVTPVQTGPKLGTVLSQNPPPGAKMPIATPVKLEVASQLESSKQPKTKVPKVVGLPFKKAKNKLSKSNLSWQVTPVQKKSKRGTVLSQNPSHGAEVPIATPVELEVQLKPSKQPKTKVPNVVGLPFKKAKNKLSKSNLSWQVTPVQPEPGTVLSQNPSHGAKVPIATLVKLEVER